MPYELQPIVEFPNLRRPIALIVDDPTPCINPLWYYRHQVDGQEAPVYSKTISLDFMRAWCEWVREVGIRGDFTVLPYPAGLGRIDVGLEGYDREEVRAWLDLAREYITPQFDIHCEILTHTNALDLKTEKLLPISEQDWTDQQDEATLAHYFATAMQILKDAGLPNYGLTQPVVYKGDESMYARAILAAEKQVNGRSVTHNLVHMDAVSQTVPPRITHLDPEAGEAVISVWVATNDYIWGTQEPDQPYVNMTPEQLADRFLTADGSGGRLVELMQGSGPMVLITHWQSLNSNGTRLGFRTYQEVMRRIQALLSQQVLWCKISELTERYLVSRTVQFAAEATSQQARVVVSCPFATDILTFTLPMPWPIEKSPTVLLDGKVLEPVQKAEDLLAEACLVSGSNVTISLKIERNVPREIVVQINTEKTT